MYVASLLAVKSTWLIIPLIYIKAFKHRPTVASNLSCSTVLALSRVYRWRAYANWPTAYCIWL